jgi:SsrA-binding protein
MSLLVNKKASLNYEIEEKYVAGIELFGYEVKSLRNSQGSLDGSYVTVRGGEAYLHNVYIPPYQEKNTPKEYDSRRNRRLLLNKNEIRELADSENTKGLTIVPLSVYNKGTKIKLDIAIVRGKKKYDKRESIKKKDSMRDVARDLKNR